MLSKESSIRLLTEKMGIENVEEKLELNKLQLLNEILAAFQSNLPFNNFGLLATKPNLRKHPEAEDVIRALLEGYGGICIVINGAMFFLLESLGYDVFCTNGQIADCTVPDAHITILVKNVQEPGDFFYCDAGFGFPSFEAISLRSEFPRIYKLSYHHFKLEKNGDTIVRLHPQTPMGDMTEETETQWKPFLTFGTTPVPFSFFAQSMEKIFTDQEKSIFLNVAYGAYYGSSISVTVKDLTLRIWRKDKAEVDKVEFKTIEEAIPVVLKYFPMIGEEAIKNGYINWKNNYNPLTASAVKA